MLSAFVLAAALTADFSQQTGKIRPELHSSGFGPTICGQTEQDLADMKAMGFKAARTHDWALVNPNQRVCDYFHIFPLMHLDAKDPKNYVFGPTDYLLKRTREELGVDVFFRLGTSIEHSGHDIHFNSVIPEDFDKMAEVFAGIVRHYNRGWADGHKWNIRYWEIWNEPDGVDNMWCLPGGDERRGDRSEENLAKAEKRRKSFIDFYVKVLKRLKSEFGDEIKVGGPALCDCIDDYIKDILEACKAAGVKPDFISWHGYVNDPMRFNREAERVRVVLDSFGFTDCELIVNEWHYFGYGDYDWPDLQRCSDPEVKAKVWTGPRSHNGIRSACFTLATLANLQRSKLDQAYYYGCMHTGNWGFKDAHQAKYKVFYALKLFGDIVKKYPVICASESDDPAFTTLAVKSADGGRQALLVVLYGAPSVPAPANDTISVKGLATDAKASAVVLNGVQNLKRVSCAVKDGKVILRRPDDLEGAVLIEFGETEDASF